MERETFDSGDWYEIEQTAIAGVLREAVERLIQRLTNSAESFPGFTTDLSFEVTSGDDDGIHWDTSITSLEDGWYKYCSELSLPSHERNAKPAIGMAIYTSPEEYHISGWSSVNGYRESVARWSHGRFDSINQAYNFVTEHIGAPHYPDGRTGY